MGVRIVTVDFEVDGARSDAEAEAFVRTRLRSAPAGPFGPCAFAGCTVRNQGAVPMNARMIAVRDFIRMSGGSVTNGDLLVHFGAMRVWSRAIRALERRGVVARPTDIPPHRYEIAWRYIDRHAPQTEATRAKREAWCLLPWELVG